VPSQILTYSLPIAPPGAAIDPNSGVLTWRPGTAMAGSTSLFTVQVTDNGSPNLGAMQSFQTKVNPLARPTISAPVFGQRPVPIAGQRRFGPGLFYPGLNQSDQPDQLGYGLGHKLSPPAIHLDQHHGEQFPNPLLPCSARPVANGCILEQPVKHWFFRAI